MSRESSEVYEFGDFRLDVDEHTFEHKDGTRNGNLPDKAFQTLTILLRNSGRLVTKRELMDEVWPDAFVEDNNLDKCIHAIRHLLGEHPGEDNYIETVRKRGYRFVADVHRSSSPKNLEASSNSREVEPLPAAEAADESVPRLESGRTDILRSRTRAWTLAGVAVLTTLGAISIGYFLLQSFDRPATSRPSIAVLPVLPINASNRDELYEIGMAESLIHRLSSMKGVVVRPISSVRQYSNLGRDPLIAGKELKADYVLASNYQVADGKVKITSQLLNVSSGSVEETYKTERDATDVFALQDMIASEVGNLLLRRFATTFNSGIVERGTASEEAYRLYLHGRALIDQRNAVQAQKAIESFEQAIQLDPNFVRAYVGLARAHTASGNQGGGSPREEYAKARSALVKAVGLDDDLAEVHAGLAESKFYAWDFAGCEAEFIRAIELDPNSDWAHEDYASFLSTRGRFDEAISEAKAALEINPNSIGANRTYGRVLYLARRYDEAIVQFKRMYEALGVLELWMHQAHEMKGDYTGAFEWFMKAESKGNRSEVYREAFRTDGWPGVRRKLLVFAREDESNGKANFYHLARLSAFAGETELTFDYLNKGYDRRNGQMVMLNVEPGFDGVRSDPRFDEMVGRIGLK